MSILNLSNGYNGSSVVVVPSFERLALSLLLSTTITLLETNQKNEEFKAYIHCPRL